MPYEEAEQLNITIMILGIKFKKGDIMEKRVKFLMELIEKREISVEDALFSAANNPKKKERRAFALLKIIFGKEGQLFDRLTTVIMKSIENAPQLNGKGEGSFRIEELEIDSVTKKISLKGFEIKGRSSYGLEGVQEDFFDKK